MEDLAPTRPPAESDTPSEPATSINVRRFLLSHGVKEHNHASEIARIINVDRSQSYRRLKGDVSWSHTDLRAVAHHFGAPDDHLLPRDDLGRYAQAGEAVPAVIRVGHLPPTGLLVPGAEAGPGESSDLVAIRNGSNWEIHVNGDEPFGARRHAIEALTIRSQPHLQVALLEDDTGAAEALVVGVPPAGHRGHGATPIRTPCARRSHTGASMPTCSTGCSPTAPRPASSRRSGATGARPHPGGHGRADGRLRDGEEPAGAVRPVELLDTGQARAADEPGDALKQLVTAARGSLNRPGPLRARKRRSGTARPGSRSTSTRSRCAGGCSLSFLACRRSL